MIKLNTRLEDCIDNLSAMSIAGRITVKVGITNKVECRKIIFVLDSPKKW